MWTKFEGPGNARLHRWHVVRRTLLGNVTLCGLRLRPLDSAQDLPGDGEPCTNCQRAEMLWRGVPFKVALKARG